MISKRLAIGAVFASMSMALLAVVACGSPDPTPVPPPSSSPSTSSSTELKDVPRNRQLRLLWGGAGGVGSAGQYEDHEIWNPFALGTTHQNGTGIMHEPLVYYSAFEDRTYPWLAESWEYNDDFTELTINTREGVTWSDGTPFSAEDVAFTLDTLREIGPGPVRWAADVSKDVESVELVDSNTVRVTFVGPRPKFMYFLTYKFDIGVYIVPKHVYEDKDWGEFQDFDLERGWPLTTGPWRVVATSPQQKIIDRADSWWAVDQGLVDSLPEVERIIYVPNPGEQQIAQSIIRNDADASLDLRPDTMIQVIRQNPNVITHTGQEAPYGYVDWWPISLFFNNSELPYANPDVRWAVSLYIDRDQLVQEAYGGAGTPSGSPLPTYAPLQRYHDAVAELTSGPSPLYDTLAYDPEEGDRRMTRAGFTKNNDGIWEDSQGKELKCDIIGFGIFSDIGPIVAAQLNRHGIASTFSTPPDAGDRQVAGDLSCAMRGHGGSVRDPYFTMRLYQSASALSAGEHQANFYQWSDEDFDRITDEVATTGIEDVEELERLWTEAMDIWLPQLPDVQLVEWYHRIPMNQTYWTGWPTQDNPYTNGAFWHLTFQLILNNLKATQ